MIEKQTETFEFSILTNSPVCFVFFGLPFFVLSDFFVRYLTCRYCKHHEKETLQHYLKAGKHLISIICTVRISINCDIMTGIWPDMNVLAVYSLDVPVFFLFVLF